MNKSKLRKVCALCAAGAMSALVAGAETISSPSGNVSASVVVDGGGRLAHSVTMDGRVVLEPSPMGVTVDGRDLGKGVRLGAPQTRAFSETYPFAGNHAKAVNSFKESVWPVLDAATGKELMRLEMRAFDDGVECKRHLTISLNERTEDDKRKHT